MDGLITADEVKAVSRSEWAPDAATGSTSSQGSYFTNLRVAGVPIGDDQPPNTTVPLPGVGQVTFYETIASNGPDGVRLETIMIHVVVTDQDNPLGLPVGSEYRISMARTAAGPY
ncbi:MAG: hypothetical protein H0V04_01510 [Chloroflexi bacterium]|nr:hypothetical protein [Chloroflexota bacterium]